MGRQRRTALGAIVSISACFAEPPPVDPGGATSGSTTTSVSGSAEGVEPTATSDASSTSGDPHVTSSTTSSPTESSTGAPNVVVGPIFIGDNSDDGQILPDGMGGYSLLRDGEASGAYLGEFPTGFAYPGYFRFQLADGIPAGATIRSAQISLFGTGVYEWNPESHALRIEIEDSADAPQVADAWSYPYDANPLSVPLLPTTVRWPPQGGLVWQSDARNESPDIAELLQDLVDAHGGLPSGAHLQLWIAKAPPLDGAGEVNFVDYYENPGSAAALSFSYAP